MIKLIFSKQYLKTKLVILTLIITVSYHYLCKDKNLYNNTKQHFDVDKKQDHTKNDYKDVFKFEDEDIFKEKFKEDPFDDNAAIIPSKWVLEYWMSIRRRKPAVNIPSLSKGIVAELDTRKVIVSGFFDSKILKAFLDFCKVNKYKKKGLFYGLFCDALSYIGISNWEFFEFLSRFFGKNMLKYYPESFKKSANKFYETVNSTFNGLKKGVTATSNAITSLPKLSLNSFNAFINITKKKSVDISDSVVDFGNLFVSNVCNTVNFVFDKFNSILNSVGNPVKSITNYFIKYSKNDLNKDDRNNNEPNNNTAINIGDNNDINIENKNNNNDREISDNINGDILDSSLLADQNQQDLLEDVSPVGLTKSILRFANKLCHVTKETILYCVPFRNKNILTTSSETNTISLNNSSNMTHSNEVRNKVPSFDDLDENVNKDTNEIIGGSF